MTSAATPTASNDFSISPPPQPERLKSDYFFNDPISPVSSDDTSVSYTPTLDRQQSPHTQDTTQNTQENVQISRSNTTIILFDDESAKKAFPNAHHVQSANTSVNARSSGHVIDIDRLQQLQDFDQQQIRIQQKTSENEVHRNVSRPLDMPSESKITEASVHQQTQLTNSAPNPAQLPITIGSDYKVSNSPPLKTQSAPSTSIQITRDIFPPQQNRHQSVDGRSIDFKSKNEISSKPHQSRHDSRRSRRRASQFDPIDDKNREYVGVNFEVDQVKYFVHLLVVLTN